MKRKPPLKLHDIHPYETILCPCCEKVAARRDPTSPLGMRRQSGSGSISVEDNGDVLICCCYCGDRWKFGTLDVTVRDDILAWLQRD